MSTWPLATRTKSGLVDLFLCCTRDLWSEDLKFALTGSFPMVFLWWPHGDALVMCFMQFAELPLLALCRVLSTWLCLVYNAAHTALDSTGFWMLRSSFRVFVPVTWLL